MKGGGSVNKVILSGRLTRDPELRKTQSGNSMTTFCVAVRSSADKTNFVECIAYEKLADLIYVNVIKGEKITVLGSLNQRTYEGSDGKNHTVVEVFVQEAEFTVKPVGEAEEPKEPKQAKAKKNA